MILSIQAIWLGCDWWDRTLDRHPTIWAATCSRNDELADAVAGMDPCLMDGTQTFDLSRHRFGGRYN